jgi:hypothetical protein
MVQADYRGARGSNAGDDFHELWSLRQALGLLDPDTGLTAVAVEGLRAEDEAGIPLDTWDGVDCTLYYGSDQAGSAERIVIDQVKYSAANPDKAWTVARLTQSTNKKKDNSVIGRLAKAFSGVRTKWPVLVENGKVTLGLISNQNVAPAVIEALSGQSVSNQRSDKKERRQSDLTTLFTASKLQNENFKAFARLLDFSACGSESRFALDERVYKTISGWTDDDSRTAVNALKRFIRSLMMPEAKGELITRQSILAQLNFSDPEALFPCPSPLKKVEILIPRQASQKVVSSMLDGVQRICLHGEGGCGKTTALQEIGKLLPSNSLIIIFDCYGDGRYLDSDAYRHRPQDAFLQLANDLSRQLRVPLLLNRSRDLDYPKAFKKRLERAAEVVASCAKDAILVIAIDAADNSVTAASTHSPAEQSFIHEFMALGELPKNVRFIVSCRTGRLPTLHLPHNFSQQSISGFSQNETAAHVRGIWHDAPGAWIEDFHHFSNGNPRVQRYALDYANAEPARALDYLRPHGKKLEQVFREQLEHARHKAGHDQDITVFCAGLVALPRPVPMGDLSAVTGLSELHLRDLCSDLAPGVRLMSGSIGFADEDFEDFVRSEAAGQLGPIKTRIADHFVSRHKSEAYSASHIAAALLAAGRGREIIDLVNTEREPLAIHDPVLRREAQLQRLRIAMKVCREAGDRVDAMLTLLIGAEALKTDAAIRDMLVENPDLAAYFARDTSGRTILRDPEEIENHGRLLFHLMAVDARNGDSISVREGRRQIQAWFQRRKGHFEGQKKQHPHFRPDGWSIEAPDIAAETEALLLSAGPRYAIQELLRWRPKSIALRVASILSLKLIMSGKADLIESCIAEAKISEPWNLFLLIPLALSGRAVNLASLETSLASLLRRHLIRPEKLRSAFENENATAENLDMILTACEVVIARGGNRAAVIPVLERFANQDLRRHDQLYTSQIAIIDHGLRAHTLLSCLNGHKATVETFLIAPPELSGEAPPQKVEQSKRQADEKREELRNFIGPLIDIYDTRARILIGLIPPENVDAQLQSAITSYQREDYRLSRDFRARDMRTRAALSITKLMALPSLNRSVLFELASSLMDMRSAPFGLEEIQVLASFALDRSLHQRILSSITDRARAVRGMKTSAEDKIAALIRFARFLLPISNVDSASLFNEAIAVAGEVNVDAVHEIALFEPFAECAVGCMTVDERRAVACSLAIVVGDVGVRLAGHDHFPWTSASRSLATLDVCLALATAARWEDSSIVDRAALLPGILEIGLQRRELSPVQVVALSSLLDQLSVDLIARIIGEASEQRGLVSEALAEELAREELWRFGREARAQVSERLSSLVAHDSLSFWVNRLAQTTAFQNVERTRHPSSARESGLSPLEDQALKERLDPFTSIDWTAHRFISTEDINDMVGRAFDSARALETFASSSTIFALIRNVVAIGDRVSHLEALCQSKTSLVPDYELVNAISDCIDEWHDTPSIIQWCRERLIHVIVDRLPAFSCWLANGRSRLPALLKKSGASNHKICTGLLEGMERHVDTLSASTVYALVGLTGRYCTSGDAAQVLARYTTRLVERTPIPERDPWDLTDIPIDAAEGVARLIYAFMGDVDVRIRWRAAHAVRRLARLRDGNTIDKIVGLYSRTSEKSYRMPDAPFYWMAARLWLLIALERIATETPPALAHHGSWLLDVATDNKFPHILVRSFAKSALSKLLNSGTMTLNKSECRALKRADKSLVHRKRAEKQRNARFQRYEDSDRKKRRFHFDSLDTLPYWYSRAIETFADLGREEFLDAAERWIVDRWGIQGETWRWDQEIRQSRFSDRSVSSMHSQGSLPILERFHTYLEWHAMFCSAGELLQTRALSKTAEDDYGSFEKWVSGYGLTDSSLWLSDLRGPKPREDRLWFPPQDDINAWVENCSDDELLLELGLVSDDGTIVVKGFHETRSCNFRLSTRIETALVSPETASALVRALQTVEDSWDYLIPTAGHQREIDAPPYKLVGWIEDAHKDLGIDERDPFRYEVNAIECRPSGKTAKLLDLKFIFDNEAEWSKANSRNKAFKYEAWGEFGDNDRDDRLRYDKSVRSRGWRLRADKMAIHTVLSKTGLDLIVEIEITKRNKGYEYARHDEETAKEVRFDKVVVLRRNGSIETAEGRFGTWTAPGKRVGH